MHALTTITHLLNIFFRELKFYNYNKLGVIIKCRLSVAVETLIHYFLGDID